MVDSLDYFSEPDELYYEEETFLDVVYNCIKPSIFSIHSILLKLILANVCSCIIISLWKPPPSIFHLLSAVTGIYLINSLGSTYAKILTLIVFVSSYVLLYIIFSFINKWEGKYNERRKQYLTSSNIVKCSLILILVLCEYFIVETETWMEIRGIIMIFSMKTISLMEDIENRVIKFPTILQYVGYSLCGANVLFGPWISFQDYLFLYTNPTKKNIWWLYGIARAIVVSVFFLAISNCWGYYLIPDGCNLHLLVAYREALSFRTSHYFICYLSEASMLSAGFKNRKMWNDDTQWRYIVTAPFKIETPTALAVVVTNWNKPMHDFLKKYVFKSWLPFGKFHGILGTFIVSSFLHGFEVKVSVVLITIGIFSYLQLETRDYFAKVFDCCIRVHPCKDTCIHKYKRDDYKCRAFLIFFSFTTVLHLIYLGVIMDASTDEIGIWNKWSNLNFFSFWIMLINILIIL